MLFRWWDPRVFRVYLPTCNADDLKTLFAGVDHYICENKDGAGFTRYRNREGTLATERLDRWNGFEPAGFASA